MTLERLVRPELMDDPGLDPARHDRALRGLARLNRVSGSVRAVWAALRDLAPPAASTGSPLRVLDVATGGGDLPIGLCRAARRVGVPLRIDACDVSPVALRFARTRAEEAGADVRFFELDAVKQDLPEGYDAIVCALFLHHLAETDALGLMRRMAAAARRRVLIDDLRRSRINLAAVAVASRLVSRSGVVHVDAVRSVRAAFDRRELIALAARAGLRGAAVLAHRPCRMLLRWDAS